MRRLTRLMALALSAMALAAAAGCESDSSDRDDRDVYRQDRAERRRQRDLERDLPRDPPRTRNPYRDRDVDPVIGRDRDRDRAEEVRRRRGISDVPVDAVAVEAGEGTVPLTYTAERDGTVYVYDVDDDRVVFVGRVMADERFRLLPQDNQATLDGRPVFRAALNPRHRYRLYFDRRG